MLKNLRRKKRLDAGEEGAWGHSQVGLRDWVDSYVTHSNRRDGKDRIWGRGVIVEFCTYCFGTLVKPQRRRSRAQCVNEE